MAQTVVVAAGTSMLLLVLLAHMRVEQELLTAAQGHTTPEYLLPQAGALEQVQ